jgi:hypothetical protein
VKPCGTGWKKILFGSKRRRGNPNACHFLSIIQDLVIFFEKDSKRVGDGLTLRGIEEDFHLPLFPRLCLYPSLQL